jgi:hypothetical protein
MRFRSVTSWQIATYAISPSNTSGSAVTSTMRVVPSRATILRSRDLAPSRSVSRSRSRTDSRSSGCTNSSSDRPTKSSMRSEPVARNISTFAYRMTPSRWTATGSGNRSSNDRRFATEDSTEGEYSSPRAMFA